MSATPDGQRDSGKPLRLQLRRALDIVGVMVAACVVAGLVVRFETRWGTSRAALFRRLDLALLGYFLADIVLRLAIAGRRYRHLRSRWFDLLVVLAVARAIAGGRTAWAWFLVRELAALGSRFTRTRRYRQLVSQLRLHPAKLMVGSFAGAILVGTVLLSLPEASATGGSLRFVDALFTATSATCVTGLIVKDTGSDFTLFGQFVILVLIQLGGLGIMTFSVSLGLALGARLTKSREVVMQDVLDQESIHEVLALVRFILVATFAIEAAGAVLLFFCFGAHHGYSVETLYTAIFHSVSAFCNAGFSVFRTSLMTYRGDVWINLVMIGLITVGGLGFPVLRDLFLQLLPRRRRGGRAPRLRMQTKVVLATSAALVGVGAVVFYAVERGGALGGMTAGQKALACAFQSVTARTAGFNTVDISQVGSAGLLLMICLMFIGASPGSTGGGVKTTTFAILLQAMRATFRRRPQVDFFQRAVPMEVVRRAVALIVLSALLVLATMVVLMSVEGQPFRVVAFETVSAFGTVGLSAGATPLLTDPGRLIITALMFVGRLGPLTLALSLLGELRPARFQYAEERIMVG